MSGGIRSASSAVRVASCLSMSVRMNTTENHIVTWIIMRFAYFFSLIIFFCGLLNKKFFVTYRPSLLSVTTARRPLSTKGSSPSMTRRWGDGHIMNSTSFVQSVATRSLRLRPQAKPANDPPLIAIRTRTKIRMRSASKAMGRLMLHWMKTETRWGSLCSADIRTARHVM